MRPRASRDSVFSVLRFQRYCKYLFISMKFCCTVSTENQEMADKEEAAFGFFNY